MIATGLPIFTKTEILYRDRLRITICETEEKETSTSFIIKLFHIFIVEGIKESLVEDSLQKGIIISLPFLNGYTAVLCIVGGINVQR
jgi:hypothetical protein